MPSTRHPDAPRGAVQSLGVEAGFDASSASRFEEIAAAELGGFVEDPRLVSGLGPWVQLSAREPLSQERVALWIRPRSRLPERATRDVLELAKRLRASPLPAVIPLRRFGCTDELLWLIGTEFPGSTLSEWFGQGSAPSVEGVKTFLGLVLPPLQAIHEAGLVHGALSAESFHRDADGVIRICRPGIDVPILRADLAAGTPSAAAASAPPEVRSGGEPTPASDQYALAAAVVWMLTGRPPEPDGQSVSNMPRTIPRGWQPGLRRALDSTPARRFPDLGAFWNALRTAPMAQGATAVETRRTPTDATSAPSPLQRRVAAPAGIAPQDVGEVLFPDGSWQAPLKLDEWVGNDSTPARRGLGLMVLLVSTGALAVLYDQNVGLFPDRMSSLVGVWADERVERAGLTPPLSTRPAGTSDDGGEEEERPGADRAPAAATEPERRPANEAAATPRPEPAAPEPPVRERPVAAPTADRSASRSASAEPPPTAPSRAPARAIAPIRASRPDPAPTPPAAPGSLSMQTYPWGAVYIDGRYVGTTPLVELAIAAGPHEIRVEREGQPAYVREITVQPGQAVKLTGIVLEEPGR